MRYSKAEWRRRIAHPKNGPFVWECPRCNDNVGQQFAGCRLCEGKGLVRELVVAAYRLDGLAAVADLVDFPQSEVPR
jgi:hypothetical protein